MVVTQTAASSSPQPKLRLVKTHWAIDGQLRQRYGTFVPPDPRLPEGARRFWTTIGLDADDPCDGGVVATVDRTVDREVVGFCRYNLDPGATTLESTPTLAMSGTWVDLWYRNQGLGVAMWTRVLRRVTQGTQVYCTTVSQGGERLVNRLEQTFPLLKFQQYRGHRYNEEW